MRPSERKVRIFAGMVVVAGLAASGLAVLAEELGVGAEAAQEMFGWKRVSLLVAGVVLVASGALLFARPRIASRLVNWERMGRVDREVRIGGALLLAAGLAASGLAILAEELGVGAEAARGSFGWKRVSLLAAGVIVAAAGTLLFARPRVVSRRVDFERVGEHLRSSSDRYSSYLAIGLLGLLGVVLLWTRLMHIDDGLWHDEAVSATVFSDIGALLENTAAHVLYNFLSERTTSIFGESEAMLRFWSVAPAIAAIGFGAWWAWRRIGRVAAVAFAVLAVTAPLHLELAPQARGYGLAVLAAMLMLIAADRLAHAYSRWTLLGFLGAGLAGIATLIFFAFSFIGQALSLLRWPNLRVPVVATVAVAGLLSLLLYAPVITPFLQSDAGNPATAWGEAIPGETLSLGGALLMERTLDWLIVPIATLLTVEDRLKLIDDALAPGWAGTLALALIAVAIVALWRRKNSGLALMLVLPPLLFNLGFSLGGFSTVARHQIVLLPHIFLLVAIGIAEVGRIVARPRILRPLAVAGGVFAVLAASKAIVEEEQAREVPRENFKEAAEVARWAGIDPIATNSDRPTGLLYYLGDDLTVLGTRRIEALLCERGREMVYIRHPWPDPRSRVGLDCLVGTNAVRVRVSQRERGYFIDVWIIAARGGVGQVREEPG